MTRKIHRCLLALTLVACIQEIALATNIETGEGCGFGITTRFQRMMEFTSFVVPPTSLAILAAITAVMARRRMRTKTDARSRRRWGITVGMSLAVLIVSISSSIGLTCYYAVAGG